MGKRIRIPRECDLLFSLVPPLLLVFLSFRVLVVSSTTVSCRLKSVWIRMRSSFMSMSMPMSRFRLGLRTGVSVATWPCTWRCVAEFPSEGWRCCLTLHTSFIAHRSSCIVFDIWPHAPGDIRSSQSCSSSSSDSDSNRDSNSVPYTHAHLCLPLPRRCMLKPYMDEYLDEEVDFLKS
jgi:hypothetical protein